METEISRLLAENIAIREEAINARAEAEKWRASHRLNKEVIRMKSQLETKLSEVNALVEELGALPDKLARRSSHRRRREGFVSELVKNPEEREGRNKQTNPEQEGRLPAILEDKCYPRKTLEQEDIRLLVEDAARDSLESPDLGPPPVAHFDEAEPLAFDAAKSPRRTSTELIEESEKSANTISINFESKRKRRTSSLLHVNTVDETSPHTDEQDALLENDTISVRQKPVDVLPHPAPAPRAGAKRKLEMSELEDTSKFTQEPDDFVFRKPSNTTAVRSSRFSRTSARANDDKPVIANSLSSDTSSQQTRKILAPKSTNSPAKRLPTAPAEKNNAEYDLTKEHKPERRIVSRVRTRPNKIEIPAPQPSASNSESKEDDNILRDPKTPGDELPNILSPASIDPPPRHEPKEMAVINSVEDVLNGSIGRGSRRARAAVSYAPPKLNTKLRREGKELVGAVEGISKIMGSQLQSHARSTSEDPKQDDGASNSTVRNASDLRKEKQRRNSSTNGEREGGSEPVSPSIVHQGIVERRGSRSAAVDEALNRLSIFDHPESPMTERTAAQQIQTIPEPDSTASTTIQSKIRLKRHSSVSDIPETDDLVKGHGRSASASRLSNVPQRSTKRGGLAESTNFDTAEIGGLKTRTSALTHRRSMLV